MEIDCILRLSRVSEWVTDYECKLYLRKIFTEFFTESKTDKKDELIQKLTEAEASRNQIQSDAKQMADELVAQYNRFQTEQDELKAALEKEHTEQLRQAGEQFETEKNTLLENFGEKYQHLETENEGKISGMRF